MIVKLPCGYAPGLVLEPFSGLKSSALAYLLLRQELGFLQWHSRSMIQIRVSIDNSLQKTESYVCSHEMQRIKRFKYTYVEDSHYSALAYDHVIHYRLCFRWETW